MCAVLLILLGMQHSLIFSTVLALVMCYNKAKRDALFQMTMSRTGHRGKLKHPQFKHVELENAKEQQKLKANIRLRDWQLAFSLTPTAATNLDRTFLHNVHILISNTNTSNLYI